MRLVYLLISVTFILMITSDAFPLTGGNGVVTATVYGVAAESGSSHTQFRIDMSATHPAKNPNPDYLVELVDSEDRVHGTFDEGDNFGRGYDNHYNGSVRGTLVFTVPQDAIIKRLKITPDNSDPFSIDWNGVPRTSANGITMQFYNGQRVFPQPNHGEDNKYEYQWIFDIKVTNTKNTTLSFSPGDFAFRDNNGWIYIADKGFPAREIKMLPNESLRFPITFNNIGEFARPSEIIFNNVTMDIGAWV
jgi:hypothetical protein